MAMVRAFVVYGDDQLKKWIAVLTELMQGYHLSMTVSPTAVVIMKDDDPYDWFILGHRMVMKWPSACPQHPQRPLFDASLPYCADCAALKAQKPVLVPHADIPKWTKAWQNVPWNPPKEKKPVQ